MNMLDNQLNGIEVLRKITTVVEELENLLEQRYGHLRLIRHFLDNLTEELAATLPEHRPQRNFIKIYEVEVVPNARIVAIGYVVITVAAPVHVDPESQPAPSTPELPEAISSCFVNMGHPILAHLIPQPSTYSHTHPRMCKTQSLPTHKVALFVFCIRLALSVIPFRRRCKQVPQKKTERSHQ